LNLPTRYWLLLIAACVFAACNQSGEKDVIAAKVGDKQLIWADISEMIPDNSSPEDSAELADQVIQSWIREQVILNEAELTLADDQKNFDQLIENYRKSLLTYTYEQEWVKQKLDTNVTQDEIETYYNENIQNFQLRDYILKVKFCAISIDTDTRQLKNLRKLFYSTKEEDITPWIAFCVNNGASYFFDEDKWLLWDDFVKQIPVKAFDREAFLKQTKEVEFELDNNLYLIRILDYQLSGSQSPLSFEKENIRNMILNRRKLDLLVRMREDLYNKALAGKKIEIYYTQP